MKPTPLTRVELDRAVCSHQDCDKGGPEHVLWLHGRCHQKAGTRVCYSDGVLSVLCRICKQLVCEVQVAPSQKVETA